MTHFTLKPTIHANSFLCWKNKKNEKHVMFSCLCVCCLIWNSTSLQVWERGVVSPVDSPRALTNDLPTFSRSPLPYITEVCLSFLSLSLLSILSILLSIFLYSVSRLYIHVVNCFSPLYFLWS